MKFRGETSATRRRISAPFAQRIHHESIHMAVDRIAAKQRFDTRRRAYARMKYLPDLPTLADVAAD
jgi:hypothetical protein